MNKLQIYAYIIVHIRAKVCVCGGGGGGVSSMYVFVCYVCTYVRTNVCVRTYVSPYSTPSLISLYLAQKPPVGQGLLIHEVSRFN